MKFLLTTYLSFKLDGIVSKAIFNISLLLFMGLYLCGQSLLSKANQLIDQEQFEESIQVLEKMVHESVISKEVYTNLAYAYYGTGDLPNAVLYYERALKMAPRDPKILNSLEHVKADLPIQITVIPDFILLRAFRHITNYLSSTNWSIVQIILAASIILLITRWLFFTENRSWTVNRLMTIAVLLSLSITAGIFSSQRSHFEEGGDSGISHIEQSLFKGPDDRSGIVSIIGPGNKVFILETIGEWYKVELEDKDVGWIRSESISLI